MITTLRIAEKYDLVHNTTIGALFQSPKTLSKLRAIRTSNTLRFWNGNGTTPQQSNVVYIVRKEHAEGITSALIIDDDRKARDVFGQIAWDQFLNGYEPPPELTYGRGGMIHQTASIGCRGEGWYNHNGKWLPFPQIAGVLIGDDVSIGAFTAVKRGSLTDTIIGDGTKIGSHCSIGHGAVLGQNCMLYGGNMVAGSAILGVGVTMGIGAKVINKAVVPSGTFIKAGKIWTQK